MSPWFPAFDCLTPEEITAIRLKFQQVFRGDVGESVLASILGILGFFSPGETERDLERQNAAKEILYLCGAWDEEIDIDIVRKLMGGR